MKQIVVGFGFFMIVVLTMAIVMAVSKESIKKNELEQSVELAVYQSLQEGIENKVDPGMLFESNLLTILSDNLLDITIVASDYEKGILSVLVQETFVNLKREKVINVERTVIYERKTD